MSERTPCVAANWKMHKTLAEAAEFVDALLPAISSTRADVIVCPSFLALSEVLDRTRGSAVSVAAQNMHESESGAFTGEVSATMLLDIGVEAVILGHSERRQLFGETDDALARKVPAALAAGLTPILCVGEIESERDSGETEAVVSGQLRAAMSSVEADRMADVIVAYEPVWAIGTGRTATGEQAQEACSLIRGLVAEIGGDGERLRIQYGGSVKPENAGELLSLPDVDGALVGGAALDPKQFAAIVEAA